MNLTIKGTCLELNDKLRSFITDKVTDSLRTLGGMDLDAIKIAIEIERTSNRHLKAKERDQLYRSEATVSLPGRTLRIEESAMDVEHAITKLKQTLTRDLRKWKERKFDSRRKGARKVKEQTSED